MNPGSIYIEARFPVPWPPRAPYVLIENEQGGSRVRLIVSSAGRPELHLRADGEAQVHHFQTIKPMGVGYTRLSFSWGGGPPCLFINGKQVRSLEAAGDEVLEIPVNTVALPTSQEFDITREALGRMNIEERLFMESLHELERRLADRTSYELLMASGVVRKLLLDETPIAHQANRHHRLPLVFHVRHPHPPIGADLGDPEVLESLLPEGAPSIGVTDDQLWRQRVLDYGKASFTAREVVLAAAHVLGGVHLRTPKTKSERRIVQLAERIQAMNTPLPLCAFRDIAVVVLDGLMPLARAIAKKYQG